MHLFPGILFSQLYSPSYVGLGITGCYAYMREPSAALGHSPRRSVYV
jgi:hypothetical protein